MPKIGTLIAKLAAKAGLKMDDPKLIEALSINAEVDDSIVSAFENLMLVGTDTFTLDAARSHPELLKHFNAKIFNGMDAKIMALAEENGLSPAELDELKSEKNSYEKLKLLNSKIADKVESKYKGKDADKDALNQKIKDLGNELLGLKNTTKAEVDAIKAKAEEDVINYAIESYLETKPFANRDIPVDVNVKTAKHLLQKELDAKKIKVTRNGSELKLVTADAESLDYYENNKAVPFRDLADTVLSNNKLIQVSDPSRKPDVGNKFHKPANKGDGPNNTRVLNAYNRHLADLGVSA